MKIALEYADRPVPREEYDRICDQRDEMCKQLAKIAAGLNVSRGTLANVARLLHARTPKAYELEDMRFDLRCAGFACEDPPE